MKWSAFVHQGSRYDLSHLDAFSYNFVIPAKDDKPEQVYRLNVDFSIHCFTRGAKTNEAIPAELAYSDSRETRIFDFDRYNRSKMLRGIVESLGQKKCLHDRHGNFYVFEIIDSDGSKAYYSVFFTVSRSGKTPGLNLFVTTAHIRPQPPYVSNPKPIRFGVIVHNVWHGKPVKPAPRIAKRPR